MYWKRTIFVALPLLAMSELVAAQSSNENLIPDPTRLQAVFSNNATKFVTIGNPSRMESEKAVAEFATVEVTVGGERERGVRMALSSQDHSELLYLDSAQALQLRKEIARYEVWSKDFCADAGTSACVFGVARCRPSQGVVQAFCPSLYKTSDGEVGISISTPRNVFEFPAAEATEFIAAIQAAVGALDGPGGARAPIPSTATSSDCPVSLPSSAPVDVSTGEDARWYGSDALAVSLPVDGRWKGMGPSESYGDKFWLWRRGYDAMSEPRPDLILEGVSLAGPLQHLRIDRATSGFGPGWSYMLVGLEFPAAGCWHVTATYRPPVAAKTSPIKVEQSLSFVVEVVDE